MSSVEVSSGGGIRGADGSRVWPLLLEEAQEAFADLGCRPHDVDSRCRVASPLDAFGALPAQTRVSVLDTIESGRRLEAPRAGQRGPSRPAHSVTIRASSGPASANRSWPAFSRKWISASGNRSANTSAARRFCSRVSSRLGREQQQDRNPCFGDRRPALRHPGAHEAVHGRGPRLRRDDADELPVLFTKPGPEGLHQLGRDRAPHLLLGVVLEILGGRADRPLGRPRVLDEVLVGLPVREAGRVLVVHLPAVDEHEPVDALRMRRRERGHDRPAPRVPHQDRAVDPALVEEAAHHPHDRPRLVLLGRERGRLAEARRIRREQPEPRGGQRRRDLGQVRAGRPGSERVPEDQRPASLGAPLANVHAVRLLRTLRRSLRGSFPVIA